MLLRASEKISTFKICLQCRISFCLSVIIIMTCLKDLKINSNKLDISLEIYKKYHLDTKNNHDKENFGLGFIEEISQGMNRKKLS